MKNEAATFIFQYLLNVIDSLFDAQSL